MKRWMEWAIVIIGSVSNILLWFWLLPVTPAAIIAAATSTAFALIMADWFDNLDKKRATIVDTSDA